MIDHKEKYLYLSDELENILINFKETYPLNYADMFRKVWPIGLIIISVALFASYFTVPSNSYTKIFLPPLLIVLSIKYLKANKKKRDRDDIQYYKSEADKIINELKPYSDTYPEINDYIQQIEKEFIETENHKTLIQKRFHAASIIILILLSITIVTYFTITLISQPTFPDFY